MDFSSGITVVNSVSRRTSVVSSVNHNKRVLLKKKECKVDLMLDMHFGNNENRKGTKIRVSFHVLRSLNCLFENIRFSTIFNCNTTVITKPYRSKLLKILSSQHHTC